MVNPTASTSEEEEFSALSIQLRQAEAQFSAQERAIQAYSAGKGIEDLLEKSPELREVYTRNEKLKYRKNILMAALEAQLKKNGASPTAAPSSAKKAKTAAPAAAAEEQKGALNPKLTEKFDYVKVEDYGSSMLRRLADLFKAAIGKAYPDIKLDNIALNECQNAKLGDYQCNSAMAIANKLKATGAKIRPSEVAEKIAAELPKTDFVESVDVAPAGFINIHLKKDYIQHRVFTVAKSEMHVGHLRSTIIGDSICRLLELVNFDVLRINHVGDWGTQFGMLIAHLRDKFPDFKEKTPPIGDLQAFYKESKKRFDEDTEFKARAYECVVKLQSFEPTIVHGWQQICDVSRKYFKSVYDRLDIKLIERGESFYQDKMQAVVEELEKRSVLKEEDGRKVMFPTGCNIPLTVVKSDGGFTYDTSDLAALKQRLNDEKGDWLIYVIDSGQSLHMETIFAAGRDLGWYKPEDKRVEHVGFGLVLGEDRKKFKTRSGETVRLVDLLDEGCKRAREGLVERKRDEHMTPEELDAAEKSVAFGCVKYADLSHTRTQDYVFSFDRMLETTGNTAVYLLYAYTRIKSILRSSGAQTEYEAWLASNDSVPLDHPSELKLAKLILRFSDTLLLVLDTLMLHPICDYLYQLATQSSDFYRECWVIETKGERKVHYNRMALCIATANVMKTCFDILGLHPVEKM
ncbi:unnamed protein product, partial [Mesorhabditis spiculigera]